MARFKLLAGSHILGNKPGTMEILFAEKGDIVESDRDLVAAFGPEKFEYIDGEVKAESAPVPPAPPSLLPEEPQEQKTKKTK